MSKQLYNPTAKEAVDEHKKVLSAKQKLLEGGTHERALNLQRFKKNYENKVAEAREQFRVV